MAEFPALPLFTDAYLGDTTHLTTFEHGAYLLLLMVSWRSRDCLLPKDDKLLARHVGLSVRQWAKIKPIIRRFFDDTGAGFVPRCFEHWIRRQAAETRRKNIPLGIRAEVFARDGVRCAYCGGVDGPFELDHVLPRSRGGADTADNLTVACRPCNALKSDCTPEEMGWSLV